MANNHSANGHTANRGTITAPGVKPGATQLFQASLITAALVYGAGVVIFSALSFLGTQTGGLLAVLKTFGMLATGGLFIAALLTFFIVAPMGTVLGLIILRISRPAWWQGPVTGALAALSFESLAILALSYTSAERLQWELGNLAMLSIPAVLAVIAAGYVQRTVLHWPGKS